MARIGSFLILTTIKKHKHTIINQININNSQTTMLHSYLHRIALACLAALTISSCSDDPDPDPDPTPVTVTKGAYILCAGTYDGNNATLDYYDWTSGTISSKVFAAANGRAIGNNANSMLIYGDKMYIAVDQSAIVEVTDLNGKSLKTIAFAAEDGTPENPRELAADGDYVYVTLYDGYVARINTTTLTADAKIAVGKNPEGICALAGKLYVANSGGYDPAFDNTLSVIDPASFTVTGTITVAVNPVALQKDNSGNLYVLSYGNYYDVPNTLQRVDTATGNVSTITTGDYVMYASAGDKLYVYVAKQENWVVTQASIKIYDPATATFSASGFIADADVPANVYSLSADPITGNLYVATSDYTNTGDMHIFNSDGVAIATLALSGINPRGAYFVTEETTAQ